MTNLSNGVPVFGQGCYTFLFKALPFQKDEHLLTVLRYCGEIGPLRVQVKRLESQLHAV